MFAIPDILSLFLMWLTEVTLKKRDQIIHLIKCEGLLRRRDLEQHHIHPETLNRLVKKGAVIRVGRGLYTLPDIGNSI